jgi:hypothetical protein
VKARTLGLDYLEVDQLLASPFEISLERIELLLSKQLTAESKA